MADPDPVPEPDLLDLYSVIQDGHRDAPGPAIPWAILDGLTRLISCDEVAFSELDFSHRNRPIAQFVGNGGVRGLDLGSDYDTQSDALFWELYKGFWKPPDQGGNWDRVMRWSDMYSPAELDRAPLYADFWRPHGLRHCLIVDLPTLPGRSRRVLFWRCSGPDFSDREKLIVQLLRPHLYEAYQDARRRRHDVSLTPREWQVLELAAQGCGNAEIAGLLVTSVGTVRKHMEHIFDRTGVRTRSDAIAKIFR